MSTPGTELLIDDGEALDVAAPPAPPLWAPRLAIAGRSFIAIGASIILAAVVMNPLQNLDVLWSGITLVVAGGVLRAISLPVVGQVK